MSEKIILVVEDEPKLRELIVRALQGDFTVVEADNGLSGLLVAGRQPRPDLIVTDVEMPRLDGVGMVKRLHADSRMARVPVIFLTSRGSTQEVVAGIQAGARHYLTKPFDPADLLAKVRRCLR